MKEHPILFSAQMVRALLDGSKTQTRRIAKIFPATDREIDIVAFLKSNKCPYGKIGDRLWVRETWIPDAPRDGAWEHSAFYGCKGTSLNMIPNHFKNKEHCIYRSTWDGFSLIGWKPSIHMPRWASRITLEITNVRVGRLQDISEEDAKAEGARKYASANSLSHGGWSHNEHHVHSTARQSFENLWESINGARSWDENPYVWVIEFKKVTQ